MTSDPQLERRVSRLENDRDSIYDILTDVVRTQQAHSRRFDGIDRRLDGMDRRFDGIDQRLDGMDRRFDGIDGTLAEILRRLPEPS